MNTRLTGEFLALGLRKAVARLVLEFDRGFRLAHSAQRITTKDFIMLTGMLRRIETAIDMRPQEATPKAPQDTFGFIR